MPVGEAIAGDVGVADAAGDQAEVVFLIVRPDVVPLTPGGDVFVGIDEGRAHDRAPAGGAAAVTFVVVGIAAEAAAVMAEAEAMAHLMADGLGRRVDGGGIGGVVAVEHQTDVIGGPVEAAEEGAAAAACPSIEDRCVGEQVLVGGHGHPDAPATVTGA